MAKRMVKCPYCGQEFDANEEDYVKVINRYAHRLCYLKRDQITIDDEEFWELIKKIFGPNYDYQEISRQRKSMIEKQKFSIRGIINSLLYWYEVKGNDTSQSNGGIGICPYIYEEAQKYGAYLEQQKNKDIIPINKMAVQKIKINPQKKEKKLLSFDED